MHAYLSLCKYFPTAKNNCFEIFPFLFIPFVKSNRDGTHGSFGSETGKRRRSTLPTLGGPR